MAHDGLQMGYRFYTRGQGQESPANWDEKTAEGGIVTFFFLFFSSIFSCLPMTDRLWHSALVVHSLSV